MVQVSRVITEAGHKYVVKLPSVSKDKKKNKIYEAIVHVSA